MIHSPRPALMLASLGLASAPLMTKNPHQTAEKPAGAGTGTPPIAAEASGWARTSSHAEVLGFLEALAPAAGGPALALHEFGRSEEGRPLVCVAVGATLPADLGELTRDSRRVRVLVNANIHAGEVEGKEAVQVLLRELAAGGHPELLERLVLLFVPVYNADGNERVDRRHRVDQNGPDGGVGVRENANGLDLNRDFVKAESAECRALMSLVRRTDPHVFMDLHATDGSYHGYHLTYSPSLSTNVSPPIDAFARDTLLPEIRHAMLTGHGWRVFDYGNFSRGEPRTWSTYDHRPRFGTNYYGLRNRFSILSEAYSHIDFEARVRVTHAFVLESCRAIAAHAERIVEACARADESVVRGEPAPRLGYASALAPPVEAQVLVGGCDVVELPDGLGKRVVAHETYESEVMLVQDRFRSAESIALPEAWLIPDPQPAELDALRVHGVALAQLEEQMLVAVRTFRPTEVRRGRRPFQGHHEIGLEGDWTDEERTLPAGTLFVTAHQRLALVAAQLLEPQSEDSLSTWNVFEDRTRAAAEGVEAAYPVLRLETATDLAVAPLPGPEPLPQPEKGD